MNLYFQSLKTFKMFLYWVCWQDLPLPHKLSSKREGGVFLGDFSPFETTIAEMGLGMRACRESVGFVF